MNKYCLVTIIIDLFTITEALAILHITYQKIIQRSKNCMQQNKTIYWEISHYLVLKESVSYHEQRHSIQGYWNKLQLEISVAKNVPRYIVCSRPTMSE